MSAGLPSALCWKSRSDVRIMTRDASLGTAPKRKESRGSQPSKKIGASGGDRQNSSEDVTTYPVQSTQDQVYSGSGMEAASKSLQQLGILEPTELAESLPPSSSKPSCKKKVANPDSLTPTVILNGLAMARSEQVSYKVVKKTPLPCQPIYKTSFYDNIEYPLWADMYFYQNGFENRYRDHYFRDQRQTNFRPVKHWIYPYIFHVEVTVGDRSFIGEGKSQQIARHNAAQKALELLQTMPVPKTGEKASGSKKNTKDNDKCITKSPISLLYEKAAESRLKVRFELASEEGPPHMKYFTMIATVFKPSSGVVITGEGKGTSKNMARTNAAVAAFEKLEQKPFPSANPSSKKVSKTADAKIASVLSSNVVLHPCSRLNQILQIKHEKIPTYTILSSELATEAGFVIQCSAMGQNAIGNGKSKKEARRKAADNLLKELGFFSQAKEPETCNRVDPTPKKIKDKHQSKPVTRDVLPPLMEVNFEMEV